MSFFNMNESVRYTNIVEDALASYTESYYSDATEHALACVAESQEMYTNMLKEIGVSEVGALYENGAIIYESGDSIIDKIKSFLTSIWNKIKEVFAGFIRRFDGYFKSNKEFIAKYKKQLFESTKSMSDFKFKGYKFEVTKALVGADPEDVVDVDTMADTAIDEYNDKFDDHMETYRGTVIGGNSKLTSQEFSKELFEYFRGGSSEKEELELKSTELGDLSTIVAILEDKGKSIKTLETDLKNIKKGIDDSIKGFDTNRKTLIGNVGATGTNATDNALAIRKVNLKSKIAHSVLSIKQTAFGAKMKAVNDHMSQCKSVCVAVLAYKPKNEGFSFTESVDDSIFGSITLK